MASLRWKVFARKTAIWPRVTAFDGQYMPGPQPDVIARRDISSIHGASGIEIGTSEKTPVAAGGA